MAKRFSDSDKWKKPFLRSLQAPYKLFWLYLLDDCDHAGIWQVDMEIANIKLGENLTIEKALSQFGDKITVFDNGEKWFIRDFIDFQYGELNPKNRVHESVISILKKYKLDFLFKPLISPLQGAKDKDKEKDMDKDKINELKKENFISIEDYIEFREYEFTNLDESFSDALKVKIGIERPHCWVNKKMPCEYFDLVECLLKIKEDVEWQSSIQINNHISKQKLLNFLYEFVKEIKDSKIYLNYDGYDASNGKENFITHFTRWLKIKINGK